MIALLAGLVVLAGCVEIDRELAADGSLSLRYKYDPPLGDPAVLTASWNP